MEIGGRDYFFDHWMDAEQCAKFIEGSVKRQWPKAFVEWAGEGHDMFLYEDMASYLFWEAHGMPENGERANMIYALCRDNVATLVCDPGEDSERVAKLVMIEILKLHI